MRTIIAGSRSITDLSQVEAAIKNSGFDITTIISGAARGVDRLGEVYAEQNNIPIERYPAEWDKYGKSAGYRRNKQMVEVADAVIAVWDGTSKGTAHTINIAKAKSIPVHVEIVGCI